MLTDFTADQLSAVEFLKRDACIVAGPGSGKTTVLVERYRRLLEDHRFAPREILAITFTEKAAANMKAKLAALFSHDAARLRELESAWVSTIHGFCARLLRENAIAAGLDPRFAVLSPRESDKLQWECMTCALDELAAQRYEATLALIEALQSPGLGSELKEVYDAIRSAGMSIAEVAAKPNPAPAPPALKIAPELRQLVSQWPFGITPKQRTEKARLLEWCVECEGAGEVDLPTFLTLIDKLDLNLGRVPKGTPNAELKEFRERLRNALTAIVDCHAVPFRAMIFDVLARFDEEYRNRKKAQSRVDFNDLERHAIALLKNNPDVRSKVHEQFRQVMLDEFQDINNQQAELIRLIRGRRRILRRRRPEPVDLRLPPCSSRNIPPVSRRGGTSRRPVRSSGTQLPQPRGNSELRAFRIAMAKKGLKTAIWYPAALSPAKTSRLSKY